MQETQAILHTQHVRKILDTLDPQGEDENVESLAKNGGIDVWKMWAKPQLDNSNARPGTVKSYLASVAKFCEFIIDQVKHKVSGLPEIKAHQVEALTNVIP